MLYPLWVESLASAWSLPDWKSEFLLFSHSQNISVSDGFIPLLESIRVPQFLGETPSIAFKTLLLSASVEHALQQSLEFSVRFQAMTHTPFNWHDSTSERVAWIFGHSFFLSRFLICHPIQALTLSHSSFFEKPKSLAQMESELSERFAQKDWSIDTCKQQLRLFKYEEYLRMTARDLSGIGTPEEVLDELSSVATVCVRFALEAARQWIEEKTISFKTTDSFDHLAQLVVIAMGKLGGNELNYSSDIDLILLQDDPPLEGFSESHLQKINKIARLFVDLLTDITAEGFVARVDLRLRPGGEMAPLVPSISAAEAYYFTRGELWERQALIKARVIAGNTNVGNHLLQVLIPFIYSKIIDQRTIEETQRTKLRIEEEHLKSHLNVKLGVGGIREIEFFIQVFQLLYGGTNPSLRLTNSLQALQTLKHSERIASSDFLSLRQAYLFLRKVEHALQLKEEQQTHHVPLMISNQKELARTLGYHEHDLEQARYRFLTDLNDTMLRVRTIFGGLFSQAHVEIEASMRNHTHFKYFSSEASSLLEETARQLAVVLKASSSSHLVLRFQSLFEIIGQKIEYYQLFLSNPSILNRICRIAETSDFLWSYLLNHLDLIGSLDLEQLPASSHGWEMQLKKNLDLIDSEEEFMDRLREFKHANVFLIGSAELEGLLNYEETRRHLTSLARAILQAAYLRAQQQLQHRFPLSVVESRGKLSIIGMGKLGGGEITYGSDLDLVFIYSEFPLNSGLWGVDHQEYYLSLVRRVISLLSTFTQKGVAYTLDTRLRPSGNAGILITSLEAYRHHHLTSKPWEHQALLKSAVVGGDEESDWHDYITTQLNEIRNNWIPPLDLGLQIKVMRQRKENEIGKETASRLNLKEGFGGLLDIEYLVQFLQLKQSTDGALNTPDTLSNLQHLQKLGVFSKDESIFLEDAYKFLRQLESYLHLVQTIPGSIIDFDEIDTSLIMQLFLKQGRQMDSLREEYLRKTKAIREKWIEWMTPSPI